MYILGGVACFLSPPPTLPSVLVFTLFIAFILQFSFVMVCQGSGVGRMARETKRSWGRNEKKRKLN